MADKHWVSELFPVKFSADDALKIQINDKQRPQDKENAVKGKYEEVYERVIFENAVSSKKISNRPKITSTSCALSSQDSDQSAGPKDKGLKTSPMLVPTQTADNDNVGIWTKEELELFRCGYLNLKKKAMKLLVLLSVAKSEIKKSKRKCKVKENFIQQKDIVLSEQRKEIEQLNATVSELKKDVAFHKSQWQNLSKIDVELKKQILTLKKDLRDEKNQTQKFQKICRNLKNDISEIQRLADENLIQQKTELEMENLHNIKQLRVENLALKEELEIKLNECKLNQVALDKLRRHFANIKTENSKNLIDVVDV